MCPHIIRRADRFIKKANEIIIVEVTQIKTIHSNIQCGGFVDSPKKAISNPSILKIIAHSG